MCYYRKIKTMMLLMLVCVAAKAQLSDGKVYNFVNVANSASSMSIITGNNISIAATDTTGYGQLWQATMNDDGSYYLRNLGNGRYLRSSNVTSGAWTMVKTEGLDANCKLGSLTAGSGYTLRATNTRRIQLYALCFQCGADSVLGERQCRHAVEDERG